MSSSFLRLLPAVVAIAAASLAPGARAQTDTPQEVKVVNTPKVVINNAHTKPVPVYDVHHSDPGEPFMIEASFLALANAGGIVATVATVPADRRYVIEHVSASCFNRGGVNFLPSRIGIRRGAEFTWHHFPFAQATISGTSAWSAFTTPMKLEAAPNDQISFTASLAILADKSCDVTISGRSYWL